jgi:hypothetical protein
MGRKSAPLVIGAMLLPLAALVPVAMAVGPPAECFTSALLSLCPLAPPVDCPLGVSTDACGFQVSMMDPYFTAPWQVEGDAHPYSGPLMMGGHVALAGEGVATVHRAPSTSGTCGGHPQMLLEASPKPFGMEPSVTITWFGGDSDNAALAEPCANGHLHQPTAGDITGAFPDGAWSAAHNWGFSAFHFSVSAPMSGGMRHVSYTYTAPNGDMDTFAGDLYEFQ